MFASESRLTPVKFTLNSTIAFIITVTKGSAMYVVGKCLGQWKWVYFHEERRSLVDLDIIDDASRGPWGSFKMITKLHTMRAATLGAFATLLGTGFHTSGQQILTTEVTTRLNNDTTATFGLAENYFSGAKGSIDDRIGVPDRQ